MIYVRLTIVTTRVIVVQDKTKTWRLEILRWESFIIDDKWLVDDTRSISCKRYIKVDILYSILRNPVKCIYDGLFLKLEQPKVF